MTIQNCGNDGVIAIGLTPATVQFDELPGIMEGSIGFYGDDGCISQDGDQVGEAEEFTTQDRIGMCLTQWTVEDMDDGAGNVAIGVCQFTKNGALLEPKRFIECKHPLYPSVGFAEPGAEVRVNFGPEFKYDVASK